MHVLAAGGGTGVGVGVGVGVRHGVPAGQVEGCDITPAGLTVTHLVLPNPAVIIVLLPTTPPFKIGKRKDAGAVFVNTILLGRDFVFVTG